MKILQAGVAKSGNLWLYSILQQITKHANLEQQSYIQKQPIYEIARTWKLSYDNQVDIDVLDIGTEQCFCRISSIYRMPIDNIDDYIQQSSHIWTHSLFCERSFSVLSKLDKIIYIIRDPRDVAISLSRYAFKPYYRKYYPHNEPDTDTYLDHRLKGMTRHWVHHVGGYLKHRIQLNIHVVFYENFLHSFDTELESLLHYLNIELDTNATDRIRRNTHFTTMKQDNPDHVRKGASGEWTKKMRLRHQKQVARIAEPILKLLNYPLDAQSFSEIKPSLSAQANIENLDYAIEHTNRSQGWVGWFIYKLTQRFHKH